MIKKNLEIAGLVPRYSIAKQIPFIFSSYIVIANLVNLKHIDWSKTTPFCYHFPHQVGRDWFEEPLEFLIIFFRRRRVWVGSLLWVPSAGPVDNDHLSKLSDHWPSCTVLHLECLNPFSGYFPFSVSHPKVLHAIHTKVIVAVATPSPEVLLAPPWWRLWGVVCLVQMCYACLFIKVPQRVYPAHVTIIGPRPSTCLA